MKIKEYQREIEIFAGLVIAVIGGLITLESMHPIFFSVRGEMLFAILGCFIATLGALMIIPKSE